MRVPLKNFESCDPLIAGNAMKLSILLSARYFVLSFCIFHYIEQLSPKQE